MHKTGIEYGDVAWNPVIGCERGCSYCWARRQAERGLGIYAQWPKGERFRPRLVPERFDEPYRLTRPSRILTCFMGDLFHEAVPDLWIHAVLKVIRHSPAHSFLLLTKSPERYTSFSLPANAWAGVTVTGRGDEHRLCAQWTERLRGRVWVSYEPVLGPFPLDRLDLAHWVVVGAQTGPGAIAPDTRWVEELLDRASALGVPVFLKDNLRWPYPLRQYPDGMVAAA